MQLLHLMLGGNREIFAFKFRSVANRRFTPEFTGPLPASIKFVNIFYKCTYVLLMYKSSKCN